MPSYAVSFIDIPNVVDAPLPATIHEPLVGEPYVPVKELMKITKPNEKTWTSYKIM